MQQLRETIPITSIILPSMPNHNRIHNKTSDRMIEDDDKKYEEEKETWKQTQEQRAKTWGI